MASDETERQCAACGGYIAPGEGYGPSGNECYWCDLERQETMMVSEPMSDERLAEIRSMLDGFQYGTLTITSVTSEQAVEAYNAHHGARWAIQDLLADNERLRAREAALEAEREQAMAVIRAVAHVILPYTTPGEEAIGMIAGHTVEQARALLAASTDATTAERE